MHKTEKSSFSLEKILLQKFYSLTNKNIEIDLRTYQKSCNKINKWDLTYKSDQSLEEMSIQLIERVKEENSLDAVLYEAFALAREAAHRVTGMRPFDVQVAGGLVLHQGKIAEMQTGEGKTLTAVLPAYLNALTRKGVHILTFNDYLARRDAQWMGPVYKFLGLTTGCVQEGMSIEKRQKAYNCDITYITAKEAGFDFLRDQLCYQEKDVVHRPFHYAIVDEADSIMIDEARIPLVIAGVKEDSDRDPYFLAKIIRTLQPEIDFYSSSDKRNVNLSSVGIKKLESHLKCGNLFVPRNLPLLTELNLALHAEILLRKDVDYIVRNGRIEHVDEFTGRVVEDRHWPDGLQTAVEAKENLKIGSGGSILGSITLQHFLQLYQKVSGMTATAKSAAEEYKEFYNQKIAIIPPNKPCIRKDKPDVVFSSKHTKEKEIVKEIKSTHISKRPVLVGTASVEESEKLASLLKKEGICCNVLNAKNDEKEAEIIACAGEPGAVTISTNMAGRGTDIKLGGNKEQKKEEVMTLGGLYVIGTNRNESLRIDRQLRGRAGRQGDPGESRFFTSLEDELFLRYGLKNTLPKSLKMMKQDQTISSPIADHEISRGQRILESQNLEIRKTLWKYSFVVEEQRRMIQKKRKTILKGMEKFSDLEKKAPESYFRMKGILREKKIKELEKQITLFHIDKCWAEHLSLIDMIRESIHLVSVGGREPVNEFNKMVTDAFLVLDKEIEHNIIQTFKALGDKSQDIDLDKEGLRGPSSTWTYLVSDKHFGNWMEMLKGKNIGFAAGAALYAGPFLILWGILDKIKRRKNNAL